MPELLLRESKELLNSFDREGMQDKVILSVLFEWRVDSCPTAIACAISADTDFCGLSQYYDERIFESFIVDNNRVLR